MWKLIKIAFGLFGNLTRKKGNQGKGAERVINAAAMAYEKVYGTANIVKENQAERDYKMADNNAERAHKETMIQADLVRGAQTHDIALQNHESKGWFDALVTGINRLQRPWMFFCLFNGFMALWALAYYSPETAKAVFEAGDLLPEYWIQFIMGMYPFIWGGRELHYHRRHKQSTAGAPPPAPAPSAPSAPLANAPSAPPAPVPADSDEGSDLDKFLAGRAALRD